jgi:hypothetical protein
MRIIRCQLDDAEARVAVAGARAAPAGVVAGAEPVCRARASSTGGIATRQDAGTFFICLANTR